MPPWVAPDGWMDGWRSRLYEIAEFPTEKATVGKAAVHNAGVNATCVNTVAYQRPNTGLRWNNSQGPFDDRGRGLRYLGTEMRRRIEGGAPPSYYRREHGKPQYPPDWYDSKHTYPQWALEGWWRSEEARRVTSRVTYGTALSVSAAQD